MMNPLLKAELLAVFRRQRRMHMVLHLAWCWSVLALLGLAVLLLSPPKTPGWFVAILILAVVAAVAVTFRNRRASPDWNDIARRIELLHPELNGLLLTAVQQEPADNGQLHFLQQRVLRDALVHSHTHFWSNAIPSVRLVGAHFIHVLGLVSLLYVLGGLWSPGRRAGALTGLVATDSITVTPGDTAIERGERLVVIASFAGSVPAQVELVTDSLSASGKRIPLVKSLADPIFGGSIPEVTTDLVYRVEYGGKRSRDYTVKVFEYPRLERADADLTFPDYTGLAPRRIENTRRISAVEGTRCNWTLQLNKPVVQAQLIAKGSTSNTIPLVIASNSPLATLTGMLLETNRTYLLQLVDADGRTNKSATQFVVDVLKNREPELKIVSPRGDTRPSALEEITFEGTVWDDFGVQAFGLAYTTVGSDIKFVELGRKVPAKEKHPFKHLLRLEDLGVKPDQLITWFLWAEDIGPDGQLRRTAGDMYFAEVRPFDEVFRQGQGGGDQQQQQAGGQSGNGGGGSPQAQLADLQKQIINATWKLQRQHAQERLSPPTKDLAPPGKSSPETSAAPITSPIETDLAFLRVKRVMFGQPAPGIISNAPLERVREKLDNASGTNKSTSASQFVEDLGVVRDAVAQAITQAQEARQRQRGDRDTTLWDDLIRDMEKSRDALDKAAKSPASLAEALAAEQSAFQVLLRLQQREYEVSRNRNRSSQNNQSSRNQQMQRQLDQLDVTQPENRYENERLAQSPQSQERREQLQVMNRLSELSRRQQDLNNRLQELQTSLQEAKTEQEREEIQRQLKRLQEEQQQMLSDMDELQQRMNQPENQASMNEQRQQLDQTRQEMQRAAEAAQQGAVSQALASGTRAQRELEQMREDMRQQNSSAFAEDLRQLRTDAREALRHQDELRKQMDSFSDREQKTLDDSHERQQAIEQLARQAERLTNLVARATGLSQQTEEAEPLASKELYDTLRKFALDDAAGVRNLEDELIQHGLVQTELYRRLLQLEKSNGVKSVELTQEMLRQGLLPQAQQADESAGAAVRTLKEGIERAAEKVVGDDTEALRLAQQQLDRLTDQVQREVAQGQGTGATNGQTQASSQTQTNGPSQANRQTQASPQARTDNGQPQTNSARNQQNGGQRTPGTEPAQNGNQNQAREAGQSQPRPGEAQTADANQGAREGTPPQSGNATAQNPGGNRGPRNPSPQRAGTSGGLPSELQQFLNEGRGGNANGPVITGEDFTPWSDGLREVEEMVDDPALQSRVSAARERARQLRQEYRRTHEAPEWAAVDSQVVKPLVEVRNQIAEELARRGSRESLVPIDRDPVPGRFSEQVRRYYEELGKDK